MDRILTGGVASVIWVRANTAGRPYKKAGGVTSKFGAMITMLLHLGDANG